MSSLVGDAIIYSLKDLVERQVLIYERVIEADLDEQTRILAKEQVEFLAALLKLCERFY